MDRQSVAMERQPVAMERQPGVIIGRLAGQPSVWQHSRPGSSFPRGGSFEGWKISSMGGGPEGRMITEMGGGLEGRMVGGMGGSSSGGLFYPPTSMHFTWANRKQGDEISHQERQPINNNIYGARTPRHHIRDT